MSRLLVDEHSDIRKVDFKATLALIIVLIFWSAGPLIIKYLTGYVDSWTQNLLRYTTACLFWLPFLLLSIKKGKFDRGIWRRSLAPAAANLAMQSLYAGAFYYIGAGLIILLTKSSIIWIAGFSLIFFVQERPLVTSKSFWLGLILSIAGLFGVMFFKEDSTTTGTLTGIVLATAVAFMWAVYTLAIRIAFKDTDSCDAFAVISIYTVAGLAVLALLFGEVDDCLRMGFWQWMWVVVSGVMCIALGHVLFYVAIRRIGATLPSLVILAQPFTVLAISYFIFGEVLSPLQSLSGIILLAGSAFAIGAQQHLKDFEKAKEQAFRSL